MTYCLFCLKENIEVVMDFGKQPISNRFLKSSDEYEFQYDFKLGICHQCGLIQLVNPINSAEVKPKFHWIKYAEPEDHINDVIKDLTSLTGIESTTIFCGISNFESSFLHHLNQAGYKNTCLLNTTASNPIDIIENTIGTQNKIKKTAEVIIVRNILEHAHQPLLFLASLVKLLNPNGYLVLEVPDYTRNFKSYDYSSLWEEHIIYFTLQTFLNSLNIAGLETKQVKKYQYSTQDYLVAIVTLNKNQLYENKDNNYFVDNYRLVKNFTDHYAQHKKLYRDVLIRERKKGKIALMGAGHIACKFINLLDIEDLIDFIIDDDNHKTNLFMPGSKLPILSSRALMENEIKLCLLSLNEQSEKKVLENKKYFIENGGKFSSIFSTSQHALVKF